MRRRDFLKLSAGAVAVSALPIRCIADERRPEIFDAYDGPTSLTVTQAALTVTQVRNYDNPGNYDNPVVEPQTYMLTVKGLLCCGQFYIARDNELERSKPGSQQLVNKKVTSWVERFECPANEMLFLRHRKYGYETMEMRGIHLTSDWEVVLVAIEGI